MPLRLLAILVIALQPLAGWRAAPCAGQAPDEREPGGCCAATAVSCCAVGDQDAPAKAACACAADRTDRPADRPEQNQRTHLTQAMTPAPPGAGVAFATPPPLERSPTRLDARPPRTHNDARALLSNWRT